MAMGAKTSVGAVALCTLCPTRVVYLDERDTMPQMLQYHMIIVKGKY
jgi:hypothetical protein